MTEERRPRYGGSGGLAFHSTAVTRLFQGRFRHVCRLLLRHSFSRGGLPAATAAAAAAAWKRVISGRAVNA